MIDIGNGHTSLLPSLLWIANSVLLRPFGPQTLGIIGIISFYQMFYGTLLYFTNFFINKRHHGKTFMEVCLFVGLTNGIWFVFPVLGVWASIQLVLQNSFAYIA